jgi:hypothetical protein
MLTSTSSAPLPPSPHLNHSLPAQSGFVTQQQQQQQQHSGQIMMNNNSVQTQLQQRPQIMHQQRMPQQVLQQIVNTNNRELMEMHVICFKSA